jgi:hypothetical protein
VLYNVIGDDEVERAVLEWLTTFEDAYVDLPQPKFKTALPSKFALGRYFMYVSLGQKPMFLTPSGIFLNARHIL